MPKIVPKGIQTCFEQVLGQIFRAQFSMECRVFETFQKKIKKFSKFQPKTHKTVPKRIQKCFEHVLGQFFPKIFQPSAPWRLETSKIFKKVKIISKFQKCPKSFPKVFKRGLNKFWGKFLEKFLTSFPWSVESSKHFKKKSKNFQKSHQKRTKPFQKNPKVF